jgi:hypothetical protein
VIFCRHTDGKTLRDNEYRTYRIFSSLYAWTKDGRKMD